MATHEQSSSRHLAAARELLDELRVATLGPEGDAQTKATAAAAHAILVLAEQVAVVRVLLAGGAVAQHTDAGTAATR